MRWAPLHESIIVRHFWSQLLLLNTMVTVPDMQYNASEIDPPGGEWSTGWDNYDETTTDPGTWLLFSTCLFCALVMGVVVPSLLWYDMRRHASQKGVQDKDCAPQTTDHAVKTNLHSIVRFDHETRDILRIAVPFTVSGLANSSFSNICLAMVGCYVGTKEVAAFALVQILVGLTDAFIKGPIHACTALCSHAVGAGNHFLAGQYIQLAVLFYLLLSIPAILFWRNYMAEIILILEWGDNVTANIAEEFIHVYIWSYILKGISNGLWSLLEVADHASEVTTIGIAWGLVNAVLVTALVTTRESTLTDVACCFVVTDLFFIFVTLAVAELKGWLCPYKKGLWGSLSLVNGHAVKHTTTQAVPLAFGSLLSHGEWAILTFMASALGPAEVAAWAILGSIWDVFYSATSGIGDAAALRVGLHFGANHPNMAKLAGYKALLISMSVATIVSIFFFSLQDRIPGWFTVDPTLQAMLRELMPFVGVGNFSMQFGMTAWSLIGAQGRYDLATRVSFVSSWGVCMPLAAIFVFYFRVNLQGLTAAVVVGYVTTGASLSYVLLSTNWKQMAQHIQQENVISFGSKSMLNDDETIDPEFDAKAVVAGEELLPLVEFV